MGGRGEGSSNVMERLPVTQCGLIIEYLEKHFLVPSRQVLFSFSFSRYLLLCCHHLGTSSNRRSPPESCVVLLKTALRCTWYLPPYSLVALTQLNILIFVQIAYKSYLEKRRDVCSYKKMQQFFNERLLYESGKGFDKKQKANSIVSPHDSSGFTF